MEDPYKILGVPKNFTEQQLKDAFKKLALVLHPDKPTGNSHLFKIVTNSFRVLAEELKARNSDKQFYELKNSFTNNQKQPTSRQNVNFDYDPKNFNVEKFNKIYEDNRLETATDVGYDDFLRNEKIKKMKEYKKSFTADSFNSHFEKAVKPEQSKHLIKYTEPEPLLMGKKIQFTELGEDNIEDFSGDNMSKHGLHFMDLKIAHTTNRIIDPRTVEERKEYKNVEQYEADRANINYQMNAKDLQDYQKRKYLEEQKEKKRINTQMRLDQMSEEQFNKVHSLLLGRN